MKYKFTHKNNFKNSKGQINNVDMHLIQLIIYLVLYMYVYMYIPEVMYIPNVYMCTMIIKYKLNHKK